MSKLELEPVELKRNDWEGVSYQFEDGSELLSLITLGAKADMLRRNGQNPGMTALYDDDSVLAELNQEMTSHWIPRTSKFESKVKADDRLARTSAEDLTELDENYDFKLDVEEVQKNIDDAVSAKKEFRTKSLLHDFDVLFEKTASLDIWLKLEQRGKVAVFAAQLAGFTIRGSGVSTAIEPLIFNDRHRKVLLPKTVYAKPFVNLRIKK